MAVELALESSNPELVLGLVEARGVRVGPAPASLAARIDEALARRPGGPPPPEESKRATRDLLRHGGFKPTGRNKPASEYLAQAAAQGRFPRINNVVDALNLVSLETGIPISLVDADVARGEGRGLVLREGKPGESFVFNAGGQVIDVEGLISLARAGGPCLANPVKDSLETKTTEVSTHVLAVLYGSTRLFSADAMHHHASALGSLLEDHAGATEVHVEVMPG